MNFKVGEEVLCVRSNILEGDVGCLKGSEYPVLGIHICQCGQTSLNIGSEQPEGYDGTDCAYCGFYVNTGRVWWQGSFRFVRKSSSEAAEEMLNKIVEEVELEKQVI